MKKSHKLNSTTSQLIVSLLVAGMIALTLGSCRKYLDAKPDQSISTPSTLDDLEGIMNAYGTVNARYPAASEVASDDFYLTAADYNGLVDAQRFYYTWQKSPFSVADYTSPYQAIEYANVVLGSLRVIKGGDAAVRSRLEGNALFVRAAHHYALAQLYAKPFVPGSPNNGLGIVLRLTDDVADKPKRATIAQTYASIIEDLQRSLGLLPAAADVKYRAGRPAAYGMLARVYLSMSNFDKAERYADSALNLYSKLIDYNTLSTSAALPLKQFNDEVIYDSRTIVPQALAQAKARIDTGFYASYVTQDLRRSVFFKSNTNGSYAFKGSYTGVTGASLFTGIATDELYLIKAETAVRNGHTQTALGALNTLLASRWRKGTFTPLTITDPPQLLSTILKERRKELVFRTLRWTDLRRLNQETSTAKTLTRNLGGTIYTLEPNSTRYVFQIDQRAIDISGLEQNP